MDVNGKSNEEKKNCEEAKQFNPTYFWLQYTKDAINVEMLAITCKSKTIKQVGRGEEWERKRTFIQFNKTMLKMFNAKIIWDKLQDECARNRVYEPYLSRSRTLTHSCLTVCASTIGAGRIKIDNIGEKLSE